MQTLATNPINLWRLLTVPAIITITKSCGAEAVFYVITHGIISMDIGFLSRSDGFILYLPEPYRNRSA